MIARTPITVPINVGRTKLWRPVAVTINEIEDPEETKNPAGRKAFA
jgi:hypothetical protein